MNINHGYRWPKAASWIATTSECVHTQACALACADVVLGVVSAYKRLLCVWYKSSIVPKDFTRFSQLCLLACLHARAKACRSVFVCARAHERVFETHRQEWSWTVADPYCTLLILVGVNDRPRVRTYAQTYIHKQVCTQSSLRRKAKAESEPERSKQLNVLLYGTQTALTNRISRMFCTKWVCMCVCVCLPLKAESRHTERGSHNQTHDSTIWARVFVLSEAQVIGHTHASDCKRVLSANKLSCFPVCLLACLLAKASICPEWISISDC